MTKLERTMFIYAFRYALPRHTGAINDVMETYIPIKDNFEEWEIKQMIDDIDYQIKTFNSYKQEFLISVNMDIDNLENFKRILENNLLEKFKK